MANTIRVKRSYTAAAVPTGLLVGEIAVNAADKKIYISSSDATSNILISSLAISDHTGNTDNLAQGSTNKYYTDSLARAALSSSATGLTYTSSTGVFSLASGYSIPATSSQTNWDSAYSQRLQWDGGATNLVANTARSSLGLVIGTNVQAWDADLDAIAAIAATSGLLKKTAANTYSLDSSAYLTGNQTVTLTGDVTGSGATSIATTLATVSIAKGGTGQTTAGAAVNALLPSQAGNSGKYLTTNGTDSSWGTVSSGTTTPAGVIEMYAPAVTQTVSAGTVTTTAPTGYLLCNGDAVSRTTYSALWTALGQTSSPYGQGNGSTTFNLPDLRSRAPIGVGTGSGLTARTLGGTVGAENVAAPVASHTHQNTVGSTSGGSNSITGTMNQANPHAHLNAVRAGSTGGNYYRIYDRFANESNTLYTENTDINHTHNIFINNVAAYTGSGDGVHNNMQPSIGLNFIIKT